jgi:hypothetical protein
VILFVRGCKKKVFICSNKNAVSGFAAVNVFRCVAICQLGCNADAASIVCSAALEVMEHAVCIGFVSLTYYTTFLTVKFAVHEFLF